MVGEPGGVPEDVEAAIKATLANPNRAEATLVLALIANRAAAALHQVARSEASARKGQPNWGRWAALANVSRDAVLRTAAGRQTATQLARADQNASSPETSAPFPTSDNPTGATGEPD
jgi:hypothetical protein